jgi:epimerase transport system membrane fusion protein
MLIKEGDLVVDNQLLIKLDDTELKAGLEILRSQQITLTAQLARLDAERNRKPLVSYPDNLLDDSDLRVLEAKHGENEVFISRKNAHEGEIGVLKQRINQLSTRIMGLQAQKGSKQQLTVSYQEELKELKELIAEGFARKQRLRDVERSLATFSGEIANLSAEIAGDEVQIGEARLQILQLEKRFQEQVAQKLGEVQTQLYDVNQRMLVNRDKLMRTEIKAPSAGRVLALTVHHAGGVISAGRPIMDIVPQDEELIVSAQVSVMDIDRVHEGLLAEVRFSSFKQAQIPKLYGKLVSLSADRLTDERSGASYYQAQIELTTDSYGKLGDVEILPGMPAEVLINTGERTAFEYFMQPISIAFARAFTED